MRTAEARRFYLSESRYSRKQRTERQQVDMRKAEGEVFIPRRVFLFL